MAMPERVASSSRPHIAFLDGVRGAAALYVVLFHFLNPLETQGLPKAVALALAPFRFGHLAVTVFIVLSGFTLMLPVVGSRTKDLTGGTGGYFLRRARRILPPYYATVVVTLLVMVGLYYAGLLPEGRYRNEVNAGNIITHFLLIHNWFPQWILGINSALWSVATEWQIYFFLPFLLLPMWKRFGMVGLLVSGFALSFLVTAAQAFSAPSGATGFDACPWYLGMFALGGGCAAILLRARQTSVPPAILRNLVAIPLLVLCGLGWVVGGKVDDINHVLGQAIKDDAIGSAAALLILAGVWNAQKPAHERQFLVRLLESPTFILLGLFSYSLYLTHNIPYLVIESVLPHLPFQRGPLLSLLIRGLIGVPVALGLAYLFYLIVEKPILTKRPVAGKVVEQGAAA